MDSPFERYPQQARKLCDISLARLPRLIHPATGLCVFRADGESCVTAGTSVRYTAITALGLERAERSGLRPSIDRGQLLDALDATRAGVDNSGDLGLVLWAAARDRRRIAERALGDLLDFDDVLRSRGGDSIHSTELAWVVIGLAEALGADVGSEREVRIRLDRAFRRLLDQRGASGLVGFARPATRGRAARPREQLRASLGFFDAQVYTIVAALRRDAVAPDPEAREAARVIGEHLLRHQRSLGQWAWHYDVRTGDVVDIYPVYSVHQDGMAPMALLALERALGVSATPAVARGVDWLFGRNELGELMAIEEHEIIWRSIRRRAPLRRLVYPFKAMSLVGLAGALDLGGRFAAAGHLEVDREFRPYHLGWCLYAFSEIAAKVVADEEAESRPTLKTGHAPASVVAAQTSNTA